MITQEVFLLYIILGCIVGIIYGLRKVYQVEARILELDDKITKYVVRKRK